MPVKRWVVGLLAALALAAPAELAWAQARSGPPPATVSGPDQHRTAMNARVFDTVWNRVKTQYYDPSYNGQDWVSLAAVYRPRALSAVSDNDLYRVLNEMLDHLDDAHSSAQTPTLARFDARRNELRPLLGLQILRDADRYVLEDVKPGSPAERADVEFGWEVRSFNGQPYVPGSQLDPGVPVSVEFRDTAGAVRTVQITPELMAAPVRREARWAEPGVLVLAFDEFNFGTTSWIDHLLDKAPPGTRLVLDLRGNRGGLVMEARSVLGCFLPRGQIWARYHGRRGNDRSLTVGGGCSAFRGPMAVIVSGSSRSAAELVPGALQESGRAAIVGRKTAGAVLIALESRLPDGGRFNMSVEDVRLASGTRLEHRGVSPDIEAYTTLGDRRAGRDPALEAAVEAVRNAPASPIQSR
jgi:carboxyl-terminal processing protease